MTTFEVGDWICCRQDGSEVFGRVVENMEFLDGRRYTIGYLPPVPYEDWIDDPDLKESFYLSYRDIDVLGARLVTPDERKALELRMLVEAL